MTSSLVILDTEAIYGYVSGATQEEARGEREAEGKTQRQDERTERQDREMKRQEPGGKTAWER